MANGILVDGLRIKDASIQMTETGSNPISTSATKATLWVRNDATQSLMMTDDASNSYNILASKGSYNFADSTGITRASTQASTDWYFYGQSTTITGRGISEVSGQAISITSVVSGTGSLARFTAGGVLTGPFTSYLTIQGFTQYTNGIYQISATGTTWIELVGVNYTATDTGTIKMPDEITIANAGLYSVSVGICFESSTSQTATMWMTQNGVKSPMLAKEKMTSGTPRMLPSAGVLSCSANDKIGIIINIPANENCIFYSAYVVIC